jgi:hypothetical protein
MPMIPAFLLVLLAVVYRIAVGIMVQSGSTSLSSFAPVAAIALCSAVYFPGRYKFIVPLAAMLVSDLVLNAYYGASMVHPAIFSHYFGIMAVAFLGLALQNRASWKTLLPASLAGSLIFYVITNTFSWLADPGYMKNFAGLIQALTVGLPAYSATPAWMFLRNAMVSDLIFTCAFVLCISLARSRERSRAASTLARAA